VLIRRATPADYETVGETTEAAYEEFLEGPEDYYRAPLRDAARRDREAELWVAVDDDGQILGSVTSCPPGSPWRELSGDGEGEFRMLSVTPSARGRGVGEALVLHCEERARATGAKRMWLSTLDEMSAAQRLYTRLGYHHEPDRDWYPAPREIPDVLLRAWTKELFVEEAILTFTVGEDDTAIALGSGSLQVLATPRLLAWCEAATCAAIEPSLAEGTTSVGTRVELEHRAASPVGAEVQVTVAASYVDGRLHRYTVVAQHSGDDGEPKVVATGEITRVVVDTERFLSRL
jgi:fluoroacetyl-CoA thioesterase